MGSRLIPPAEARSVASDPTAAIEPSRIRSASDTDKTFTERAVTFRSDGLRLVGVVSEPLDGAASRGIAAVLVHGWGSYRSGYLRCNVHHLSVRASPDPLLALGDGVTLSSGQACLHGATSDLGLEAFRMAGIGSCGAVDNGCTGDLRWKGVLDV